MKLFDSHCHIDDSSFDTDLDAVIARARAAGVGGAMIVGITKESSIKAVSMAESHQGFYASVGIHPHDAKECSDEAIGFLESLAESAKVKAWGETGLDFNRMFSPQKDQEKWFIRQIESAKRLNLPLIFHERDSNGRFLDLLKAHLKEGQKGVVHCFSGNREELFHYIDLGLYIGITGVLTQNSRGEALRKLAVLIPEDRLLVETDAPYLTPAPEKKHTRRNEPAFVKSTLLHLAMTKGKNPEQLSAVIWNNTCCLFDIEADELS